MKILYILLFSGVLTASSSAAQTEFSLIDPVMLLVSDIEAYEDATAFNNYSTAYILARKILKQARFHFRDEEKQLAPFLLLYANAAARHFEAEALPAYRETITSFEKAYGTTDTNLIHPILKAGQEALRRNYRVEAYEYFTRAIDLAGTSDIPATVLATAGIAKLHLKSNEIQQADKHMKYAVSLTKDEIHTYEPRDIGWIQWIAADISLAMADFESASAHYAEASRLYRLDDPKAKSLRFILRRQIEVAHQLGETAKATEYCHAYVQQHKGGYPMLYDPSRMFLPYPRGKKINIGLRFKVKADCRATDIEVLTTHNVSTAKIKSAVADAYFLPSIRNGEIIAGTLQDASFPIAANELRR